MIAVALMGEGLKNRPITVRTRPPLMKRAASVKL
jgi:hypothetical protein